ncbi:MAG: hypothetical protein ACRCS3_08580 [Paracoccaceae bacterium]
MLLVKFSGKDSNNIESTLIARVQYLAQAAMSSLTSVWGTGLAYHRKATSAADISGYFCDPQIHGCAAVKPVSFMTLLNLQFG